MMFAHVLNAKTFDLSSSPLEQGIITTKATNFKQMPGHALMRNKPHH